jgi:hypothetical protein
METCRQVALFALSKVSCRGRHVVAVVLPVDFNDRRPLWIASQQV